MSGSNTVLHHLLSLPALHDHNGIPSNVPLDIGGRRCRLDNSLVDAVKVAPTAQSRQVLFSVIAAVGAELQMVRSNMPALAHRTGTHIRITFIDMTIGDPWTQVVFPGVPEGYAQELHESHVSERRGPVFSLDLLPELVNFFYLLKITDTVILRLNWSFCI